MSLLHLRFFFSMAVAAGSSFILSTPSPAQPDYGSAKPFAVTSEKTPVPKATPSPSEEVKTIQGMPPVLNPKNIYSETTGRKNCHPLWRMILKGFTSPI